MNSGNFNILFIIYVVLNGKKKIKNPHLDIKTINASTEQYND